MTKSSAIFLVLSLLANAYCFYRLIILPYLAEVFYSGRLRYIANRYLFKTDYTARFFYSFFSVLDQRVESIITRRDKNLENILDEVVQRAKDRGFKIKRPRIRILKRGLGLLTISDVPAKACAAGRLDRILVDEKWVKSTTFYGSLRVIMAHELGHIVGYQTKRKGHPLFKKIAHVDEELFADAFAAFLYSKEDVINFREPEYARESFNQKRFMDLDISPEINIIADTA